MTRMQFSLSRLLVLTAVIALVSAGLLHVGAAMAVVGAVVVLPVVVCTLFGCHRASVLPSAYAALVLLPCSVAALAMQLPSRLVAVTFMAYAVAFFLTYYLDHWFLGGIGYHSPLIFLVLVLVVAVTLWPLGVLSVAPSCWRRRIWKRTIIAYVGLFLAASGFAAWQMTKSWGLFFG